MFPLYAVCYQGTCHENGVYAMDYSKQGGVKPGQNKPKHSEHNAKGTDKNPYGKAKPKADLLARLKAAGQKKGE